MINYVIIDITSGKVIASCPTEEVAKDTVKRLIDSGYFNIDLFKREDL